VLAVSAGECLCICAARFSSNWIERCLWTEDNQAMGCISVDRSILRSLACLRHKTGFDRTLQWHLKCLVFHSEWAVSDDAKSTQRLSLIKWEMRKEQTKQTIHLFEDMWLENTFFGYNSTTDCLICTKFCVKKQNLTAIRYDMIEEFNVDSKAECGQLHLAHVDDQTSLRSDCPSS